MYGTGPGGGGAGFPTNMPPPSMFIINLLKLETVLLVIYYHYLFKNLNKSIVIKIESYIC